MTIASSRLGPGTLLDGCYRLGALLGEGGMGRVYDAEDMRMSRRVAVKVMHSDAEDEHAAERLFREAKGAARANHPAIVTPYGYGSDAELGVSYVVLEQLAGETLAARIAREGALPIAFVERIALELADALGAIHEIGIIHRDLKPSNLFLATRGRRVDELKLLDFGVAKQLGLPTLTATGEVHGTVMYMAPEQLVDSKRADPRSDFYSLGAVLYECLTGKSPHIQSNLAALAVEVALGKGPDLAQLPSEVPAALSTVVSRCLKRRPAERFANAKELVATLTQTG